jgi:hypothetical protein
MTLIQEHYKELAKEMEMSVESLHTMLDSYAFHTTNHYEITRENFERFKRSKMKVDLDYIGKRKGNYLFFEKIRLAYEGKNLTIHLVSDLNYLDLIPIVSEPDPEIEAFIVPVV